MGVYIIFSRKCFTSVLLIDAGSICELLYQALLLVIHIIGDKLMTSTLLVVVYEANYGFTPLTFFVGI